MHFQPTDSLNASLLAASGLHTRRLHIRKEWYKGFTPTLASSKVGSGISLSPRKRRVDVHRPTPTTSVTGAVQCFVGTTIGSPAVSRFGPCDPLLNSACHPLVMDENRTVLQKCSGGLNQLLHLLEREEPSSLSTMHVPLFHHIDVVANLFWTSVNDPN